jgi:hypothetical protein
MAENVIKTIHQWECIYHEGKELLLGVTFELNLICQMEEQMELNKYEKKNLPEGLTSLRILFAAIDLMCYLLCYMHQTNIALYFYH